MLLLLAPFYQLRSMAPSNCERSNDQTIAESKDCCGKSIEDASGKQTVLTLTAQMVARANCCQSSECCVSNTPLDKLPSAIVNTHQVNAPPVLFEAVAEHPAPLQINTYVWLSSAEIPVTTVRSRLSRIQSWRL